MEDKDADLKNNGEEEVLGEKSLMERSHINKDTYLNCWCPHCSAGLNEDDKVVFKITTKKGEVGISKMSPYLNVLDRETTMHVKDQDELTDVQCPHCDTSLIAPGEICIQDNCKMMAFNVSVSDAQKLKLILCIRRTCRWYKMSDEDNELLILRDSHEW
ncbi:MAG: hypothetical protein COA36_10240 [Desulfotalea sp.]|nr:MAG: hypothetical protein COA36_10240 [Desulfotalea sp.]